MSSAEIDEGNSRSNLGGKTARGALISVIGQGANFVLRIGSMIVLARLVTPEHFGLVGMVVAFTGVLSLFRDAGLSTATVQREVISAELLSALFWINVAIGLVLALIAAGAAPLIAWFYEEPRLVWITLALALAFVFNGAMAQHRALLQRRMRFGILCAVDIGSLVASIALAVSIALAGLGYWALVAMAVAQPMFGFIGMWMASHWKPGLPQWVSGLGAMLRYGGLVTVNSVVVYVAYNADKVLLGRFFGAETLGIYGRAYQLINIPTENLHTTLGWVMFPALARVQNDPPRLRQFFLNGYALFLAVVTPITVICGLYAEEIVDVALGPQWVDAVPVFRLLAPTILAFALINPLGHLILACGQAMRSLKIALLIAPVVIAGYAFGLAEGAQGVALGFSAAMALLVGPVIYWARQGTLITMWDILRTALPPCVATAAGAGLAQLVGEWIPADLTGLRLAVLPALLFVGHALVLLFAFRRIEVYAGLWPKLMSLFDSRSRTARGGSTR